MRYTVRLLNDENELQQVYRLRYEVYITELGNRHPLADHVREQLRDELDAAAPLVLGAFAGADMVGTFRINSLADCPRELLTYHQIPETHFADGDRRVVASMFIVDRHYRSTSVAVRLMSAAARLFHAKDGLSFHLYGERHNAALYARAGFSVGWDRPMRHPVYREVFPAVVDMRQQPDQGFYRRFLAS